MAAWAIQGFGQQAEQSFIRRRIHRRGGDADAQFGAGGDEDCIVGRPRLELDGERDAVELRLKPAGQGGDCSGE